MGQFDRSDVSSCNLTCASASRNRDRTRAGGVLPGATRFFCVLHLACLGSGAGAFTAGYKCKRGAYGMSRMRPACTLSGTCNA
ncbi:hypothetical protein PSAC2689_90168 [Paraburkholderia sacchari]